MESSVHLGTLNFDYPYTSGEGTYESFRDIVLTYAKKTGEAAVIDTAYYYGNGKTELTIGRILEETNLQGRVKITGKANPWFNNDFQSGRLGALAPQPLTKQVKTSLKHLGIDAFDTFLLHAYDYETDIQETLETCDRLYRKECFNRFGVSNFSLSQVKKVVEVCETSHLNIALSTYQGMYNVMCRKIEDVIDYIHDLPSGSFVAYNPLAGGLLTGKYNGTLASSSRFKDNKIYQNIFWKPSLLQYCQALRDPLQDSFIWLLKHSKLDLLATDAIVIGASSVNQLEENLASLSSSGTRHLEASYIDELNARYSSIHADTPNYWY